MTSGIIIWAVVLGGAALFFVMRPLFERQPEDHPRPYASGGTARQNQALETLWNEKLRVLRAIRDLDFDYDLGKLPDSTYAAQRIHLIRLAAAITRRIDSLESEIAAQDAEIEAAVAALRQRPAR
jgi:hypothetical protein